MVQNKTIKTKMGLTTFYDSDNTLIAFYDPNSFIDKNRRYVITDNAYGSYHGLFTSNNINLED